MNQWKVYEIQANYMISKSVIFWNKPPIFLTGFNLLFFIDWASHCWKPECITEWLPDWMTHWLRKWQTDQFND